MTDKRDHRRVDEMTVKEIHSESKPLFNTSNEMSFNANDEMETEVKEKWGDFEIEVLPPEPNKIRVQLTNSKGETVAILSAWEQMENGRPIIKVTSEGDINTEDFKSVYAEIMKQFYTYKNADYVKNDQVTSSMPISSLDDLDLSEFEEKDDEKKGFLGLGGDKSKDDEKKGFLGLGGDKSKDDEKKASDKGFPWDMK